MVGCRCCSVGFSGSNRVGGIFFFLHRIIIITITYYIIIILHYTLLCTAEPSRSLIKYRERRRAQHFKRKITCVIVKSNPNNIIYR